MPPLVAAYTNDSGKPTRAWMLDRLTIDPPWPCITSVATAQPSRVPTRLTPTMAARSDSTNARAVVGRSIPALFTQPVRRPSPCATARALHDQLAG